MQFMIKYFRVYIYIRIFVYISGLQYPGKVITGMITGRLARGALREVEEDRDEPRLGLLELRLELQL